MGRLLIVCVVVVAFVLGPLSVEAVASTDLAAGIAPTSDCGSNGTTTRAMMTDTNDSTQWQSTGTNCVITIDLGSAKSVGSWRWYATSDTYSNGWCPLRDQGVNGTTYTGRTGSEVWQYSADAVTWTYAGDFTIDSGANSAQAGGGVYGCITPAYLSSGSETGHFASSITARYWRITKTTSNAVEVATLSLLSGTPTAGTMGDYVRGLEAHPTLSGYSFSWSWAKSFTGSYTLHDDGCALTVTSSAAAARTAGAKETVPQTQPGSCSSWLPVWDSGTQTWSGGPGPWTLTVTDTGANVQATFVIPENANGVQVAGLAVPAWEYVKGCYNATAAQCGAGEVIGQIDFTYRLALADTLDRADVTIGPRDYSGSITSAVISAFGLQGSTTYTGTATGQSGGDWLACATNVAGTVCLPFSVPGAGGGFGQSTSLHTGSECATGDVGCWVRELRDGLVEQFQKLLELLFQPSEGAVQNLVDKGDLLSQKAPLAYFVGAKQALADALTASDVRASMCWLLDLHVGANGVTYNLCLDPIVDTSAYGTVRSIMGGFVWASAALWVVQSVPRVLET